MPDENILANIEPETREETFLQDIADGTQTLTPAVRKEEFLRRIAAKPGVPSITESDEGKILTVESGEAVWGEGGGSIFETVDTFSETDFTSFEYHSPEYPGDRAYYIGYIDLSFPIDLYSANILTQYAGLSDVSLVLNNATIQLPDYPAGVAITEGLPQDVDELGLSLQHNGENPVLNVIIYSDNSELAPSVTISGSVYMFNEQALHMVPMVF